MQRVAMLLATALLAIASAVACAERTPGPAVQALVLTTVVAGGAAPESAAARVVVPTQEPKPVASPAEVEATERELSALREKLQQTSDPESIARLQEEMFWKQRQVEQLGGDAGRSPPPPKPPPCLCKKTDPMCSC
jgi:uncharacterized membrane protein YdfJ with MMPL/SSD domain